MPGIDWQHILRYILRLLRDSRKEEQIIMRLSAPLCLVRYGLAEEKTVVQQPVNGCSRTYFPFLCKIPKSEKRVEILKKVVYNGDKW